MPQAFLKDDFKNLIEYQDWLKEAFNNLSPMNRHEATQFNEKFIESTIARRSSWFGPDTSFKELSAGVTQYKQPELIEQVAGKVNDRVSVLTRNRIKARRLRFNPFGLGNFSFERAAMTMYRMKEFYSEKHERRVNDQEVVTKRDKHYLKTDNSAVIKRWEEREDGKPKGRTTNKNVFAYFPEPPRDRHAVELFISCDVPASALAKDMLYSGVSAIIIAQLLITSGIKVKINVVIGSATDSLRQRYYGSVIPVKNYDETLDPNVLALLSSDPRFMRFDAFKGVVASFDHFKREVPPSLGYSMNAIQLKQLMEESGYTKKSQAQHRYYFGGTLSESEALRDINNTIEDIAQKLHQR